MIEYIIGTRERCTHVYCLSLTHIQHSKLLLTSFNRVPSGVSFDIRVNLPFIKFKEKVIMQSLT